MNLIAILSLLLIASFSCKAQVNKYEHEFQLRADKIIEYAADIYELPRPNYVDPEKVYWPAVIARLHKYGINDSIANAWIDYPDFKNRLPFHFILVGMARIMPLFPDAPAMKKNKLQYLKNVAARTDSYNPWTAEGTENHITMSRTSGYIFAEQMLDYPEYFPEAVMWRNMMKEWLIYYTKRIYQVGSGEFNASTYGVFNIIGFLNLYDFAKDPEVKELARAVLDYYACELALHNFQGMTSGAESRGAPSMQALAHETEYLSWLWFGGITRAKSFKLFNSNTSKHPLQPVHAVTSKYRPPREIIQLNSLKFTGENWFVNSKPSYLLARPGYIRHFLYHTPNYSLGSAMYPYGAFGSSAYKNTTWKLLMAVNDDKESPQLITGGGTYYSDRKGMIRNPYTQVAQYKNVFVMLNLLPENYREIHQEMALIFKEWKEDWENDFIKRFSAKDSKITEVGNPVKFLDTNLNDDELNGCYIWYSEPLKDSVSDKIFFMEFDKVFVTVRSVKENLYEKRTKNLLQVSASPGELCGLVLEVNQKSGFRGLDHFIESYKDKTAGFSVDNENKTLKYNSWSGFSIEVKYEMNGTFTEPIYDWGYGPLEPSHIQTSPPYIQPVWPAGKGHGRIPEVRLEGKTIYEDENLPVYSGPYISIDKAKIKTRTGSEKWKKVNSGIKPARKGKIVK
ncbi:MAG: hypothetical protein ACP5E3_04320 [Bacteroidales bacterium]